MNRLSVDCDCNGNPAKPDMHDIGILASRDPVALDQACVDLVYASKDDTGSLIERMESRNAVHVLEHGEEIGLGSCIGNSFISGTILTYSCGRSLDTGRLASFLAPWYRFF